MWMESDDQYLSRRAGQERLAARQARHPVAREAHLAMARRFDEVADAIARTQKSWGAVRSSTSLVAGSRIASASAMGGKLILRLRPCDRANTVDQKKQNGGREDRFRDETTDRKRLTIDHLGNPKNGSENQAD